MFKRIPLFFISLLIIGSFIPAFSRYQDLAQSKKDIEKKMLELIKENKALKEQQYRLQNDPVYIETVARRKLNFAKEGEIIYKIAPED